MISSHEPERCLTGSRARWWVCASLLTACTAASPPPPATQAVRAPVFFDFAFVRGAPVGGTRLTACGRVTVTTTHTERFELASFRKVASPEPAAVAFGFDRPIDAFELTVSHVDAEHELAGFNVGNPPKLSGTLLQTADGKVTAERARGADGGQGTLSWSDLNTQEITFALTGAAPGGVVVDRFFVTRDKLNLRR